MSDINDILQQATTEDRASLLSFLSKEGNKIIKERLQSSAITIEFPSWQITFYSLEDYEETIKFLKEEHEEIVPA
jgi:hypothetical protein